MVEKSATIQFQHKFCVICTKVVLIKWAFLLENVKRVQTDTLNMHAYTKQLIKIQGKHLMQCAYRANFIFEQCERLSLYMFCMRVSVCVCAVSAITLTIQHTKESCFDDTSCRVCTIRLNSVCRCMRDRAKYFGNEYKKLHYFHLVNTAFI